MGPDPLGMYLNKVRGSQKKEEGFYRRHIRESGLVYGDTTDDNWALGFFFGGGKLSRKSKNAYLAIPLCPKLVSLYCCNG